MWFSILFYIFQSYQQINFIKVHILTLDKYDIKSVYQLYISRQNNFHLNKINIINFSRFLNNLEILRDSAENDSCFSSKN